jgi:hypothetical protein
MRRAKTDQRDRKPTPGNYSKLTEPHDNFLNPRCRLEKTICATVSEAEWIREQARFLIGQGLTDIFFLTWDYQGEKNNNLHSSFSDRENGTIGAISDRGLVNRLPKVGESTPKPPKPPTFPRTPRGLGVDPPNPSEGLGVGSHEI